MTVALWQQRAERLLRSPVLAVVLVAGAAVFIANRWHDADWSTLAAAHPAWLAVAGLGYGAALLALACTATGGPTTSAWPAVLEAQLHKYIPGSVWQAQPLIASGGTGLAARFAHATLLSAALAIAVGVGGWISLIAGLASGLLVAGAAWKLGPRQALISLGWSVVAVFLLASSGAAVAAALGFEPARAGRAVGAAWGLGVAAIPVPSGIGVREATLTVLLAEQGAAVAAAHRLVTLGVDVAVGTGALLWRGRHH